MKETAGAVTRQLSPKRRRQGGSARAEGQSQARQGASGAAGTTAGASREAPKSTVSFPRSASASARPSPAEFSAHPRHEQPRPRRSGGGDGRDGKDKPAAAASVSNRRGSAKLFSMTREAQSDSLEARFASLKLKLMAALVKRQQELAQTACDLCGSILIQPSRAPHCRHAFCAVCAESALLYFKECTVCGTMLGSAPLERDEVHQEVIVERLSGPFEVASNLRQKMANVSSAYEARLRAAVRDREHAYRVVLEWGLAIDASGERKNARTFVQVAGIYKGGSCGINLPIAPESLVASVEFSSAPGEATQRAPDDKLRYSQVCIPR